MMRHLNVSLIIPAYNEAEHLKSCLEAAINQGVPFHEIIVVDNSSTDATAEIARSFGNVKLLHESQQGLRPTRNRGLNAARGDILARIDADTILTPTWCEELERRFRDESVMAVTGPCYYYDLPAHGISLLIDRLGRRVAFALDRVLFYGSNMAMRRSLWLLIRSEVCMEGAFFEDIDLTIHAARHGVEVVYDSRLVAGVAARRLAESPKEFYKTMSLYNHTFRMHHMRSRSARAAQFLFLSAYLFKPVHMTYDPHKRALSFTKLIRKQKVRPTSNT